MTNLEEAYHGLNPMVADAPPISVFLEDGQFSCRWQRATDYRGIQAIPVWSRDLADWYRSGDGPPTDLRHIGLSNLGILFSEEGETFEATIPTGDSKRTFLRLDFTR